MPFRQFMNSLYKPVILSYAHYLDCFIVGDVVMNTSEEILCGEAIDSFNYPIDNQTSSFENQNGSFENHKQPGADCRTRSLP